MCVRLLDGFRLGLDGAVQRSRIFFRRLRCLLLCDQGEQGGQTVPIGDDPADRESRGHRKHERGKHG